MGPDESQKVPPMESKVKSDSFQTKEILVDGYFYDVTDWIRKHPGGRVIEFYTEKGEDATLAVQQFHHRSSKKVSAIMKSLRRRPVTDEEKALDAETLKRHKSLTRDFTKLYKEFEEEGLFEPARMHIAYRIIELILMAVIGIRLILSDTLSYQILGYIFFGLFQSRCGFLGHETGHSSLTGTTTIDRFLTAVIYGFGAGLSSSWWISNHNRHHAMPQRLKHDVDLDTMPLVAFNEKVVQDRKEGRSFFVRYQAILFLAVDTMLVGSFWRFYLHPYHAFKRRNYLQLFFMGVHYLFAYLIGFKAYILTFWLGCIHSFGQFSLNHSHLAVTEGSLHWVEYSLLHTMSIDSSWFIDWWMGYLNYQVEHHLFPNMPQFRNRLIRDRVKALAEKHGIPYLSTSYCEAVYKTFKNLKDVSTKLQHE